MHIYSQNDDRWKKNKIGFDTGPSDTIGNYGCYITAIANVCYWAGNDLTPQQVNDLCKQNGWFVASDVVARDEVPSLLCGNLQFAGRTNWTDAVSMNFFDDASDPNVAYIVKIDASHAPGLQSHFVMVWKKLGDNDLEIDDSWDGVRKPLSHYGNPSVIIYSATKFIKISPPAPPAAVETPVPLPAPPPVQPVSPPTAPAPVKMAEKYKLLTTLQYYGSADDAQADRNALSTVSSGTYYVFSKAGIFYNLTSNNMKDQQKWINTLDNVADVPVTLSPPQMDQSTSLPNPSPIPAHVDQTKMNWRGTIDLRYAGMYVFWNYNKNHDMSATKVQVFDLETGRVVGTPSNGEYAQFSGKVKWTDGKWYGRMKDPSSKFRWYAAHIEDLVPYSQIYGTRTTIEERKVLHTLTATDKVELWLAKIKTVGTNVWDVIWPK